MIHWCVIAFLWGWGVYSHKTSHYDDVIMGTIASQITSLTIVYSALYSGADQSKHQSSASLAFVWRIHRGPVNSPHKWPVTRKMSPFDDVIMAYQYFTTGWTTFAFIHVVWKMHTAVWCFVLFCCCYIINSWRYMWSIYPHAVGLLPCHWENRNIILKDMGKIDG